MRWRALSLVGLVVVMVAAGAPPAVAQGDDSLLPGAENEQVVLVDPQGDVGSTLAPGVASLPGPDVPPSELDAALDILSVTLAETEEALLVAMKNRGYPSLPDTPDESRETYGCNFVFQVNAYNDRWFNVLIERDPAGSGAWPLQATFLIAGRDGMSPFNGASLDTALVGGDHIEVIIPKAYVSAEPIHRPIRVGDSLTDYIARCTQSYPSVILRDGHVDGNEYVISLAMPSPTVGLEFALDPEALPVARGIPTRLPLLVSNLADKAQRIALTASMSGPDGPVPGWTVRAPAAVDVPANGWVTASVFVTPPTDATHRTPAMVNVRATDPSAGAAGAGQSIVAVVPLTQQNNTLYFHNAPVQQVFCTPTCPPLAPAPVAYESRQFLLNAVAEDPEHTQQPIETMNGVVEFTTVTGESDLPIPQPLIVDRDGTIELALTMRSTVERDATLVVVLRDESSFDNLAYAELPVHLTEPYATHTFELEPEFRTIPAGSGFELITWVIEPSQMPTYTPGPIEWSAEGSRLTLPIINDPAPTTHITDGRFLPQVLPEADNQHYVRPGGTVAWGVGLANHGTETDVVGLEAAIDAAGWTARFNPGAKFELGASDQAPLCVLIQAPKDVIDGQTTHVELNGTSRGDPEVFTRARYTVRVSLHMPIEHETCDKIVGPDTEGYLAPFKEAPAPPAAMLLAALGVAVLAGRRRRLGPIVDPSVYNP